MKLDFKTLLGIAVSVVLLWWALRDVSLAEVAREIHRADPLLFLLAVVATTLHFPIRAARWRTLLEPVAPHVGFRPRFAATNIGFAVNNLLPARVGEFARALSLTRLTGIPLGTVFGTLVIERLLDGVVLIGFLFLAMASPAFPAAAELNGIDPRSAAGVLALLMGAVLAMLFFLVAAPEGSVRVISRVARPLPNSIRRPLLDSLQSFLGGLAVLRDGRLFLLSLLWAVGQWAFLALSFLLAFRAFGITSVGYPGAVFLQSLIGLAVAVPSSPGFFGPYEAAVKLGLGLWGIPADKAVSLAIGFHIGGFIPVTLIGVFYLWKLGLSWQDLGHSEEAVEDAIEADAGTGGGANPGG